MLPLLRGAEKLVPGLGPGCVLVSSPLQVSSGSLQLDFLRRLTELGEGQQQTFRGWVGPQALLLNPSLVSEVPPSR